jgi:hypothetical protein
VTADFRGGAARCWGSFRVGDDTPGIVWAVGNRPRSNGCLALSTGCAFIPRAYPKSGSTGQIDQHCASHAPPFPSCEAGPDAKLFACRTTGRWNRRSHRFDAQQRG